MNKKPDFISLFIDSVQLDYAQGGLKRLIPYVLFVCIGIGFFVSYYMFPLIKEQHPSFFLMLAALVTAQGILVAYSMHASSVILTNISQGHFSHFLKSNGLLKYYMLLVQLIQSIHIISLLLLLTAGFLFFVRGSYYILFQVSLFLALGAFLYAIRWTWGTVVIMRDLIYYRSEFERMQEDEEGGVISHLPRNSSTR